MTFSRLPCLYLLAVLFLTACDSATAPDSAGGGLADAEGAKLETAGPDGDTPATQDGIPLGQLPRKALPKHYALELTILPDEERFSGRARIEIELTESLDRIWLHGNRLEVSGVTLTDADGAVMTGRYRQLDKTGVAQVTLPRAASAGAATLEIIYDAPFDQSLEGLYRVEEDGNAYAFTQFEATSARLAFPGFDDPFFKVPFDVSLIVDAQHSAFGNTPSRRETPLANGRKQIDFETSKPLPTYLVAFAVGPFDVVEWQPVPANRVRDTAIPLRGIAVKGKGEQLAYALEHTAEIIWALEDYFRIPYPYRKLDIVAVPDFSAGAMENAGLITYREKLLLLDDKASVERKRAYQAVHAHELAHQWFGNLVTPVWWDDIWLNEAFATWMSFTALDRLEPDAAFDQDLLHRSQKAMQTDGLTSARQIRQPILSNHDIASAFDGITYSKGGGVLSMFENFMSAEQFRQGIRHYLQKFAFGTASADDFIEAISEEATQVEPQRVANAFRSFLEQPGLPHVEVTVDCSEERAVMTLSQSRYLPLGSRGNADQSWQVPVCLAYGIDGARHDECRLLEAPELEMPLPQLGCPSFVMANVQGAGYYRWSVREQAWPALLATEGFTAAEMMSISDNMAAALRAGTMDIGTYLQLIPALIDSPVQKVAVAPIAQLEFMTDYLVKPGDKRALEELFVELYGARLEKVGLQGDSDSETVRLRQELVAFLALDGRAAPLRKKLAADAAAYIGFGTDNRLHEQAIDSNLLDTALIVAVEDRGSAFARALMQRFLDSRDAAFRDRALTALGHATDADTVRELRGWMLSDRLRDNEVLRLLDTQLDNPDLRESSWQWLKANIDAVTGRLPTWRQGRIAAAGDVFCNESRKQEVGRFFAPRIEGLEGGPRRLANTLEQIELCEAMVRRHQSGLREYLK